MPLAQPDAPGSGGGACDTTPAALSPVSAENINREDGGGATLHYRVIELPSVPWRVPRAKLLQVRYSVDKPQMNT